MWILLEIILVFLPFFIVQFVLFFLAYRMQRKKQLPEDKASFWRYTTDVSIVVWSMFVLEILLSLIVWFIPTSETYSLMSNLMISWIPFVSTLLWTYFVFKALLLKEWITSEKVKKIADQTLVYYLLFGIIWFWIYMVLWM